MYLIKKMTVTLFVVAIGAWGCSGDDSEIPVINESEGTSDVGDDVQVDAGDTEYDAGEDRPAHADGDECEDDQQCVNDECLADPAWPGGHCTTRECSTDTDCAGEPGDNICVDHPDEGAICVRRCQPGTADTCRDGYECRPHTASDGWCAPKVDMVPEFYTGFTPICAESSDGVVSFEYEIDPSTNSYFLGLIGESTGVVSPLNIALPDGETIDFEEDNNFQLRPNFHFSGLAALLIPGSPPFTDQLQSGEHIFEASTATSSACLYVIEDREPTNAIDLSIYLVGLEGMDLTSTTANTHGDFQEILDDVDELLSQVDMSLGKIRYVDLPLDVIEEHRILTHDQQLTELLAYSQPPDDGGEGLHVNLFITESFTYGALGGSMGAPGMAGFHGTWFSGVGVSGEYIGHESGHWGNSVIATAIGHEIGHFLGLLHTSETDGETFDYLDDTPRCEQPLPDSMIDCPDWGNLMFPAAHPANRDLSDDQGFVLRANPLSR